MTVTINPLSASGPEKSAQAAMTEEEKDTLRKATADVESLFLAQLLKTLKNTIPESGLLPKQAGSDLYKNMFDQQLAIFLSEGKGMGIGQKLYQQMLPKNVSKTTDTKTQDLKAGSLEHNPGAETQESGQKTVEKDLGTGRIDHEYTKNNAVKNYNFRPSAELAQYFKHLKVKDD